jgi:hypothetical protein
MIISQVFWLLSLPLVIFVSYRAILLTLNFLKKK